MDYAWDPDADILLNFIGIILNSNHPLTYYIACVCVCVGGGGGVSNTLVYINLIVIMDLHCVVCILVQHKPNGWPEFYQYKFVCMKCVCSIWVGK